MSELDVIGLVLTNREKVLVEFLREQIAKISKPVATPLIERILINAIFASRKEKEDSGIIPVLQDWVGTISRRQQGVLVLALRGPDGVQKEHPCKNAIRSMRACVMNSGREGVPMVLGQRYETDSFMRMDLVADPTMWYTQCEEPFLSYVDSYNMHFYMHFLHAAAVLGFNHPISRVRTCWNNLYLGGCDKLHLIPETEEQFTYRLRDGAREREDQ